MSSYSYDQSVRSAQQHKEVHQYTTFAALEKIVGNKSLRFTRLDLLNDAIEDRLIIELWKSKVYVSCFTHRNHESYFFWKSYAKGSTDGVRLTFDEPLLSKLSLFYPDEKCNERQLEICKKTDLDVDFSPNIDSDFWGIYDYSCVDVIYLQRNQHDAVGFNFQGRVKYTEWDQECETRLRVAVRPKGRESILKHNRYRYCRPNNEYIYARLTDEILRSMQITLSPFANAELQRKVERLLLENNLLDHVQINKSVLTGEVN